MLSLFINKYIAFYLREVENKVMKFKEYYENVCKNAGIKSIRSAAAQFGLGKSAVERIKAGECDIPTDNMVNKIAAISGITSDELYHQLDYLPILSNNFALNKKILDIIKYRDLHFNDTDIDYAASVSSVAENYLLDYFNAEQIDSRIYMSANGFLYPDADQKYLPFVPSYMMSANDEIIACEYLIHLTTGNTFLSSHDLFKHYLFNASLIPGISRYVLIGTNQAEILYLKQSFEQRLANYTFKISLLTAHENGSADLYDL